MSDTTTYTLYKTTLEPINDGGQILIPNQMLVGKDPLYIQGTLNMQPFSALAEPYDDASHLIRIAPLARKSLWHAQDLATDIAFIVTTQPPELSMPEDLVQILKQNLDLKNHFDQLPESHKYQYVNWLASSHGLSHRFERINELLRALA